MSGRDGFSRADIDTNFFHDPKAVALARRLQNDRLTMAYLGLYQATVLASWKAGHRVTITEAAPAWWLSDLSAPETELRAVELLDDEGRVLEHAFEAWAGRLIDALDKAAAAGREGARRRWHPDRPPIGSPLGPDGDPIAPPMHQTDRQPDSQADARENGAAANGGNHDGRADIEAFLLLRRRAPTPKQRRLLDEVMDRHDLTGPAWAADVMMRHPDDPIGAVIEADKVWRAERIAAAQAAEKPKPKPRRPRGLPQSTREIVAEMAAIKPDGPVAKLVPRDAIGGAR